MKTIRRRKTMDELLDKYGTDVSPLEDIIGYVQPEINQVEAEVARRFALAAESETERKFRAFLRDFATNNFDGYVTFIGHSWFTFRIPGGVYTPDWCILLDSVRWVFVENKASKSQINYRDARSKLRAAATLNPWFDFYEARPPYKKAKRRENIVDGWVLEHIERDADYVLDLLSMIQEERHA